MDSTHAPRLPPLTGVKRPAPAASQPPPSWLPGELGALLGSGELLGGAPALPLMPHHAHAAASPHARSAGSSPHAMRHRGLPMDEGAQFAAAAEAGARAQREVDSARGTGAFETYELGLAIVRSSKLYANQRRSNRQLPGGSDSTTAACYMLGGTPDSTLSPLVARVSPCDPREERCKAVERVLKDKTRGAICSLNGDNPREARADNLAAVRICEVVADILVAYAAKRLLGNLQQLYKANAAKDAQIDQLRAQLEGAKRRRADSCWCGAKEESALGAPSARVSPDGIFASAVPLLNGNGVNGSGGAGTPTHQRHHSAPPSLAALARTAVLPALPTATVQLPAGSSPLGVAAVAADGYAGAIDAVAAAATQWPHHHDRK